MVSAPPYVAARILWSAAESWEAFDGTCALQGVDPADLPPPRFANAYLTWLRDRCMTSEEGIKQWNDYHTWLTTPPPRPTQAAVRPRSVEADGSPTGAVYDPQASVSAMLAARQRAGG